MATCRVCTAPIIWSVDEGSGENVPLDAHEERDEGPGRYRIAVDGEKPVVTKIGEESPLRTYVDHREICQQPRVI
jgi:hypothetical protein